MEPIKEEDTPPPSATLTPLPTIPSSDQDTIDSPLANQNASQSANQDTPNSSANQNAIQSANRRASYSSANQNAPLLANRRASASATSGSRQSH